MSPMYISMEVLITSMLAAHALVLAVLALCETRGIAMAASAARMSTTISNSINVTPFFIGSAV